MKIDTRKEDDIVILTIIDKTIDFANGIDFKEHIYSLLEKGQKKIIVNMENVSYIDSAGLGSIIAAAGQSDKFSSKINYCSLMNEVNKLFKMNNLSKYLSVFETLEKAIASSK